MKKRLLSAILTVSMVIGLVSVNAVLIDYEDLDTEDIYFEEISETVDTENYETEKINENSPLATENIVQSNIQTYSDTQIIQPRISNFDVAVTANTEGFGSVSLDWSNYDYQDKNFKVYKSSDGGSTYETIGIDYTLVEQVKVLQIYPVAETQNQFKSWMETPNSENSKGYGKGIIKVDSVSLNNFNSNPNAYLRDSSGYFKYDVLVFGTWDQGSNYDISASARVETEKFIKSGRGVVFGHDTITWTSNVEDTRNYNLLAGYFGVGKKPGTASRSSNVKIVKKGLFTTYPWHIGDIGTVLTVPITHNRGQTITNATKWIDFADGISGGDNDHYYLITKNNCAMIMTGHSNGQATADEQKILANLIFYCNQLIFDTWYSRDSSAQDLANPNAPTVDVQGSNFTWSATDNGSTYHYYVESFDKNDTTETGLIDRSLTKSLTVTAGVKKYRYILDNNASTTVTLSNGTETTATSIPENRSYNYLHIAAIDGAGNIGTTTTIQIPKTATITVNHYKQNIDGSTYTLAETNTSIGTIGNNATPSVKSYTGFTSPVLQTKKIVSGGIIIDYYYTRNKYPVIYIDKNSQGTELGRTEKQVFYETNVRGSDIGFNTADNAYYPQYSYVSDTSGTVGTSTITVYRIFEFCETEKESHLTWNDNNNADGLRPSKYTLKLKQNGKVIDEVELPSSQTDYTFSNLPKYDTNGNPYKYELDTIASERYKFSIDEDGNQIQEDYLPSSFSVKIPKRIVLDGRTGNADYNVVVNGTFYYNDILTVKPDASFVMNDRSSISSMQTNITQIKTGFSKEDLKPSSTASGHIQVNRTYFSGLWKGHFNFSIRFKMSN